MRKDFASLAIALVAIILLATTETEVSQFLSVLLVFIAGANTLFLDPDVFERWMSMRGGNSVERPASSTALSRVDSVLHFLSLFLPARIMKEDAGDAREVIDKLVAVSAPTWMIYTKLTSSVCWILLAAVREVLTVTKKKPN